MSSLAFSRNEHLDAISTIEGKLNEAKNIYEANNSELINGIKILENTAKMNNILEEHRRDNISTMKSELSNLTIQIQLDERKLYTQNIKLQRIDILNNVIREAIKIRDNIKLEDIDLLQSELKLKSREELDLDSLNKDINSLNKDINSLIKQRNELISSTKGIKIDDIDISKYSLSDVTTIKSQEIK